MANPPVLLAKGFGIWLRNERKTQPKRSLERMAQQLRPHLPGMSVHKSLVGNYEKGRVPHWAVLIAYSRVYGVPLEELVMRLAMELSGASETPIAAHPPDQAQEDPAAAMLNPAWQHAKPSHQQAALTVLRLGRKGSKRKPMPGAETERRRLVDYLAEERSELGSDQG